MSYEYDPIKKNELASSFLSMRPDASVPAPAAATAPAATDDAVAIRDLAIVELLYASAIRVSELAALRREGWRRAFEWVEQAHLGRPVIEHAARYVLGQEAA